MVHQANSTTAVPATYMGIGSNHVFSPPILLPARALGKQQMMALVFGHLHPPRRPREDPGSWHALAQLQLS